MEAPNIPRGLALLRKQGFKFDIMATSFFVSRRSIRPSAHSGMPLWQDKLFISLAKSAERRHRLLPDPDRARGGGRNPGDGLSSDRLGKPHGARHELALVEVRNWHICDLGLRAANQAEADH